MPLQNKVDPFGAIHAVSSRGLFTGNRGNIHDPRTKTLLSRRWSSKAWIICECEFRGRRREIMGPGPSGNGSWTELFFFDEVTALAAGHRPCFYCRRPSAIAFTKLVAGATGRSNLRAPELDRQLHTERVATGIQSNPIWSDKPGSLPDGAMLAAGDQAYAVRHGMLLRWSFDGYGSPAPAGKPNKKLAILTPQTTLLALRAGYQPVWHPTAGA